MRLLSWTVIVVTLLTPAIALGGGQTVSTAPISGDLPAIDEPLRGFVVAVHDRDLVVRGRDERTYAISTAGVDASLVTRLMVGQPVKVTLRAVEPGEPPAAAKVELDTGATRSFLIASGVIESTLGDQVQFRAFDGLGAPVDLGKVVGLRPDVRSGDVATLIYEQSPQNPVVAVWLERRDVMPAALPKDAMPSASPRMDR